MKFHAIFFPRSNRDLYVSPISGVGYLRVCSLNNDYVLVPVKTNADTCSTGYLMKNTYFDQNTITYLSEIYNVEFPTTPSYFTLDDYTANHLASFSVENAVAIQDADNFTTASNGIGNYLTYDYTVQENSGSGDDSGSTDMSGVVNAILMIPAVLIVLGVFTMIYRMFINRRVRG